MINEKSGTRAHNDKMCTDKGELISECLFDTLNFQ